MAQRERQKKPVGVSRSLLVDREDTLKAAVPCAKCQYNLFKLQSYEMCPECGHPIKESIYDYENQHPYLYLNLFNVLLLNGTILFLFAMLAINFDINYSHGFMFSKLEHWLPIGLIAMSGLFSLLIIWHAKHTKMGIHYVGMVICLVTTILCAYGMKILITW